MERMITDVTGKVASRLGLAGHPNLRPGCVKPAFDAGINYFFFYGPGQTVVIDELARLIPRHRDSLIIATGSGSRSARGLNNAWRKLVGPLKTNRLDVFFAEYVSEADNISNIVGPSGVLNVLKNWKSMGRIRYVGVTTHDRRIAASLVADSRVDVLMHRFNMAHRKALQEVFPVAEREHKPVVAFTATRWGTLLEPRTDWNGKLPTASDCYRYCLTQPAVQIVLTAPRSVEELSQNLTILRQRPMSLRERTKWERFGDLVYGGGQDSFETKWA